VERELIFLRHGETEWNRQKKYQGSLNIGLNEKGRDQAKKAAKMLENQKIDLIFSSDLDRASDTASIIGKRLGLKVQKKEQLREMDFGDWEGKDYLTIRKEQPESFDNWLDDPNENPPPGGERLEDFRDRVVTACKEILSVPAESVLVVCHGGVIMVYLTHILGMDLKDYRKLSVTNTGFTRVMYYDRHPVLSTFNCTAHLD